MRYKIYAYALYRLVKSGIYGNVLYVCMKVIADRQYKSLDEGIQVVDNMMDFVHMEYARLQR